MQWDPSLENHSKVLTRNLNQLFKFVPLTKLVKSAQLSYDTKVYSINYVCLIYPHGSFNQDDQINLKIWLQSITNPTPKPTFETQRNK